MAIVNYKKARRFLLLAQSAAHTQVTDESVGTGAGSARMRVLQAG